MKFPGMRVVEWVKWRWTLPARFREAQDYCARWQGSSERWKARCEQMEGLPTWKLEYERELARSAALQRRLDDALARCEALAAGGTASGLSAAEVERLALLAMAAGKLAAEAAKVVLYGWGTKSPHTGRPAYADVERGMGRVTAAVQGMVEAGEVRGGDVHAHAGRAKQRIGAK